jgi:hypothetical protein
LTRIKAKASGPGDFLNSRPPIRAHLCHPDIRGWNSPALVPAAFRVCLSSKG